MIPNSIKETADVYTVDFKQFSSWVNEYFGVTGYDVVSSEELKNDTSLVLDVSVIEGYDFFSSPERGVYAFILSNGTKCWLTGVLLNCACSLGDIPAGKYIIEVSW